MELYGLYVDVPMDRVWFLTSLSKTGYIISCESVKLVYLARLIWFPKWILYKKSNDYNVNFLHCLIANKWMALKQDGMHCFLCPKQSYKIEGGCPKQARYGHVF